ncbi:MAG TPA: hypothetical protein VM581_03235 [Magnetospirillaceae bacterium]|nr:hypothetical protein [Magnetospirillaceae bacterium]
MTNVDKPEPGNPIVVTGQERAQPAVRLLARAAIELARQQISESKRQAETTGDTPEHEGGRRA